MRITNDADIWALKKDIHLIKLSFSLAYGIPIDTIKAEIMH
jgi:hypothetical protein